MLGLPVFRKDFSKKNQKKSKFFGPLRKSRNEVNISFHNKALMLAYSSLDLYAQSKSLAYLSYKS